MSRRTETVLLLLAAALLVGAALAYFLVSSDGSEPLPIPRPEFTQLKHYDEDGGPPQAAPPPVVVVTQGLKGMLYDLEGLPTAGTLTVLRAGEEPIRFEASTEGTFASPELKAGPILLEARSSAGVSRQKVRVPEGEVLEIALRFEVGLVFDGRILDRDGGPLKGLEVGATTVFGEPTPSITGGDGGFTLLLPFREPVELWVRDPETHERWNLDFEGGSPRAMQVQAQGVPAFRLPDPEPLLEDSVPEDSLDDPVPADPAPAPLRLPLTVVVKDASGQAVGGALVHGRPHGAKAPAGLRRLGVTMPDGHLRIRLPATRHQLRASHPNTGLSPTLDHFVVGGERLELTLQPTRRILGHTDTPGQWIKIDGGTVRTLVSDSQGRFAFFAPTAVELQAPPPRSGGFGRRISVGPPAPGVLTTPVDFWPEDSGRVLIRWAPGSKISKIWLRSEEKNARGVPARAFGHARLDHTKAGRQVEVGVPAVVPGRYEVSYTDQRGKYRMYRAQSGLQVRAGVTTKVRILEPSELPEALPPAGHQGKGSPAWGSRKRMIQVVPPSGR